ncbi:receptor-transporting protein 3 [Xenopus laevis]|uniref:Receptor-transporting protein 3 n=2 Tax=Xenopus laevis TaxID=8355 RepID=A0A1L8G488_XENLA|nr:receptor-transporting protein 3 [Xenopus laevis]XP_041420695.1 receptor-transporting protein 3 [Xenopus laevis]OCT78531.1 hypothetical protein XELAEV_18029619mg [Xenopus laevis]
MMEARNWTTLFEDELERIAAPHEWAFTLDSTLQKQSDGWLIYTPWTFGRFRCSFCSNCWDSAQVNLLFLLKLYRFRRCGEVKLRIFKQKCRMCTFPVMEEPEISQENIRIAIANLVNRIQRKIYGKNNCIKDQKPVAPDNYIEGPHKKEHCEACQAKVCYTSMLNMDRNIKGDIFGLVPMLLAVLFIIIVIIILIKCN